MNSFTFDNRWANALPSDSTRENFTRQVQGALWSHAEPTPVSNPRLLIHSQNVRERIGLSERDVQSQDWVSALSGNGLISGMQPIATCYGGHQFGNWAGQLGDGRAISLGELINANGERWELQLKGAGQTPYSRSADGRAVLRSSIREFLCSEAMHGLGVPTTRALSLVSTGDAVVRDMFYDGRPAHEPGAIVCRVAPSFVRFGHFELPAARGDTALLDTLTQFVIARDFSHIEGSETEKRRAFFREVCARTGVLIAHWMRVGFVHGVMNTDNMSILGLTIDYGPYGWVDDFDPGWTPNTTDAQGRRYAFGRQPAVAKWNLACLAGALQALDPDEAWLHDGLAAFDESYGRAMQHTLTTKFGLMQWQDDDEALVNAAFDLLQQAGFDMTLFFRTLATVDGAALCAEAFTHCSYEEHAFETHKAKLDAWLASYAARVGQTGAPLPLRAERMNATNPWFVLRNYLAQQAIEAATEGDTTMVAQLLEASRDPYTPNARFAQFSGKRPDWAKVKAGCSMLSCSS